MSLRITYNVRDNKQLNYTEFYATIDRIIMGYMIYPLREHIFDSNSDAFARDILSDDERKAYNIEIVYSDKFIRLSDKNLIYTI